MVRFEQLRCGSRALGSKRGPGATNEKNELCFERAMGLIMLLTGIKQTTKSLEKGKEFNPGGSLLSF